MPSPMRPRSSRPFLAAPRADFYHPARIIDAARGNLERAIRRSEGVGLVVGPPGTGKSLLLAVLAERVRDDFDVALLTGARICTRRALWQSILSELGEPYRGIDEADLRIGVLERIRGLSATGSGLVILVDEAHTLPIRLIEELRLLSNVPTPLPAVHVVLAGTTDLEERLASPRMESLSQRVAVRAYLEPLDHAETLAYLRSQCASASMNWDARFEAGCDDAVFTITDGVPRLINQLCDHALLRSQERGGGLVTRGDIEDAWRRIQQLPTPGLSTGRVADGGSIGVETQDGEPQSTAIEFGSLDDAAFDDDHGLFVRHDVPSLESESLMNDGDETTLELDDVGPGSSGSRSEIVAFQGRTADPWQGPEVELVFDPAHDPFEEYFEQEERVVERMLVRGPDDFRDRLHVSSREGSEMGSRLDEWERLAEGEAARQATGASARERVGRVAAAGSGSAAAEPAVMEAEQAIDDSDMVVIEEDDYASAEAVKTSIFAVRPGDYRSLFARLRRGEGDGGRG